MRLIVAGATGFVATEVIRQSLSLPTITSVIALARRPVSPPPDLDSDADVSKLKSVVLEDFGSYTDEIKRQLAGADACIWTLAITPTKSKTLEWDQVRRVCQEYAVAGLRATFEARNQANPSHPFRFLYMSGSAAERDRSKTPAMMAGYCWMRGDVENEVLKFSTEHQGQIEACVAKPGLINKPGFNLKNMASSVANVAGVPSLLVTEVSAAMLDQVVTGFEKEPLTNDDLVRIGRKALQASSKSG